VGMVGIGEAVAMEEEGMVALLTRRCMCRAMVVRTVVGVVVDAIVEGMAAAASAAAVAMEEVVTVEEEEMVGAVEVAAAVVVDATERLLEIPSHLSSIYLIDWLT
jgi:hypothetical protein